MPKAEGSGWQALPMCCNGLQLSEKVRFHLHSYAEPKPELESEMSSVTLNSSALAW